MAKPYEEAAKILRDASALSQRQMDKIVELQSRDTSENADAWGGLWEAVWLVVNDPLFKGSAVFPERDIAFADEYIPEFE